MRIWCKKLKLWSFVTRTNSLYVAFNVLKAFFWISFHVLKLWFQWQLDTIKSRNKGYSAEIAVVTFCQKRQETDDMPKFRILLVSFLYFLTCWMAWFPFIRFWLVMAGVFDRWFLVFQSFGQHGRELITSEVALRILSILSKEKFLPNLDQASLDWTLDKLVIKVTTLLNSSLIVIDVAAICSYQVI